MAVRVGVHLGLLLHSISFHFIRRPTFLPVSRRLSSAPARPPLVFLGISISVSVRLRAAPIRAPQASA